MEKHDFLRRIEDLAERCARSGALTSSGFLSPAERAQAVQAAGRRTDCTLLFHGGHPDCERTVAFFLPDWMEAEEFEPAEHIRAIRLTPHFGTPGHRDYLGALLGMGIGREWLGDIWLSGGTATAFCLPSVEKHLLGIDKVGRVGVSAAPLPLTELTAPERKVKEVSFSVASPRLDAVAAGLFHLSRTEAARQIALGKVSVNHIQSDRTDLLIREGDVLSLRGAGKGKITGTGGTSRKGRLFVYAEVYQ